MEFYSEVTLETPGQAALADLTQAFVDAPTSTFVNELAGDSHLAIMFLTQSLIDVPRFFNEICRKVPEVKFRKLVSPVFEVKVSHPNRKDKGANNNLGELQRRDRSSKVRRAGSKDPHFVGNRKDCVSARARESVWRSGIYY
jgi:hypothetical protein